MESKTIGQAALKAALNIAAGVAGFWAGAYFSKLAIPVGALGTAASTFSGHDVLASASIGTMLAGVAFKDSDVTASRATEEGNYFSKAVAKGNQKVEQSINALKENLMLDALWERIAKPKAEPDGSQSLPPNKENLVEIQTATEEQAVHGLQEMYQDKDGAYKPIFF